MTSRRAPNHDQVELEISAAEQSAIDAEIRAELAAYRPRLPHWVYGVVIFLTGAVSLFAAFELATERIRVAEDVNYVPSCTAGIYYSCKSVMMSDQAYLFHFSNMFYGMAGFGAIMLTGLIIAAGTVLPKWLARTLVLGQLAASCMIVYLIYSVVANIGTMCLWCMLVWAMMAPMFAYMQSWAQEQKLFRLGGLGWFLQQYPWLVTIILYVAIFLALYLKFGNALFVF